MDAKLMKKPNAGIKPSFLAVYSCVLYLYIATLN